MDELFLLRLGGMLIVAIVLWDTFEVMLLPVPVKRSIRLVMIFLRASWSIWSTLACMAPPGKFRERILGLFGPLSLVLLITTWLAGVVIGFGLIEYSLIGPRISFLQGLYLSGSTFFTLGVDSGIRVSPGMKSIIGGRGGLRAGLFSARHRIPSRPIPTICATRDARYAAGRAGGVAAERHYAPAATCTWPKHR
jgi:hypothetical protein